MVMLVWLCQFGLYHWSCVFGVPLLGLCVWSNVGVIMASGLRYLGYTFEVMKFVLCC